MAIPTLSNNTPTPGKIAWEDFVIKYNGESFSVDAASTGARWVWWKYNNGTPSIEAGATIPSDLTDDDMVLFANKDGLGVRIQSTSLIDGELLIDGTILAEAIAANQIQTEHIIAEGLSAAVIKFGTMSGERIAADTITATQIAADSITANEIATDTITANELAVGAVTATELAANAVTAEKIGANEITGDKIAANSIATSRLIISDLSNLIVDGDLLDPASANWYRVAADEVVRIKPPAEPAYLKNTNTTNAAQIYFRNEQKIAVTLNDEYNVRLEVSTPVTNSETLRFKPAVFRNGHNDEAKYWQYFIEGEEYLLDPGTDWTVIEGTIKITDPAVSYIRWNPFVSQIVGAAGTQEIRVRKMAMRRRVSGALIVDGTIQGQHIQSNSITSDQIDAKTITGELFAAEVVMSGLVRAGDLDENDLLTGGYSEMGARGIFTVDDKGDPVASFPTIATDGAYLKAHVDLLSADVRDNFTMHGTNNSIAVESELTLSSGVEPPSVPPVLKQTWDQVQFDKTTKIGGPLGSFAFAPSQTRSMAWDSVWNCWLVVQQRSNGFRVWRFMPTGALKINPSTQNAWVDDFEDRFLAAICYNDDLNNFATVFKAGDQWWVWAPNGINKIPNSWVLDSNKGPTLTYDTAANEYVLVQNNSGASTVHTRRFTVSGAANYPNAVSQGTNNFEADSSYAHRINGAVFGSQLGVASSWAINPDTYQTVYTFSGSGVQYNDEGNYRNWLKPGASLGFAHNGTQFASVDASGLLTLYENWTWLGLDNKAWIGASAFDSDTAGNTANPHTGQLAGQHETPVGTMVSVALYRRSKLRVTMPETNDSGGADDPDKWRIWWKRGGSVVPTNKADLKLVSAIGSPTAPTSVLIAADPTGISPPAGLKGQPDAVNNFPGADPGRLESAAFDLSGSIISLRGDGAGRVGPLSWLADGTSKRIRAKLNAAISTAIPATSWQRPTLTVRIDSHSAMSNGIFTAPEDGYYDLVTSFYWASSTIRRVVSIELWSPTGALTPGSGESLVRTDTASSYAGTSASINDVWIAAGWKVSYAVYAGSATSLNNGGQSSFSVRKVI